MINCGFRVSSVHLLHFCNREEIDFDEIMDFEFDVECSADTESQCPTTNAPSLSLTEVSFPIYSSVPNTEVNMISPTRNTLLHFFFFFFFSPIKNGSNFQKFVKWSQMQC